MSFYTIKDLPESDRPREKLLKFGVENLTDSELLAIILRTGLKGKNVLDLSREILEYFGGIPGISRAHIKELVSFKGLGKTKAVTLLASFEIGRRALLGNGNSPKITSPEDVVNLIWPKVNNLPVEIFGIVTLNTKGKLISIHEITKGGMNFTSISPKEVFHPAVKDMAAAVILFHNHPSGDPTPSKEDIEVTKRILEGAYLLEIEVLDHIVLSSNSYFSFKKEGLL
ncbi:DNA repair protein RadC [Desulfurobacterium thermolithotrophum DSM 11699]|uniref:DNA repair protein RadC n=1 Tax=Desulfurobacterium thermolithotrophum (strain DSM 11699 / BSA) TaxID=868864 RepID=F0S368_DESTD|nr:DNA repair protein RadC [Desulfurobacterium thermolithotrophum]ADY73290.1 DNA repair protein RadC [Desulfurobacterium thermolithotrophum DSM 11699]